MIAIHNRKNSFSESWIKYCEAKGIAFKLVDCYADDIIEQVKDCDALMWHHNHTGPKDILFAKQLLFSLQQAGKVVFPNFSTGWHFDDKVGQKYLFESIGAPIVKTHVFYSKKDALNWLATTSFPTVFKLRGGAGAAHVKLVRSKQQAVSLVKRAFGSGFKQYDAWQNLKDRWQMYRLGKASLSHVVKGIARFGYEPEFSKIMGREKGYIYFQDFIPKNEFDTRVIVVGDRVYGLQRQNRENDFRASGSSSFRYDPIDPEILRIALDTTRKLKMQVIAYDFIYDNGKPLIIEASYGFGTKGSGKSPGYWDSDLNWHEGPFDPQAWMVDLVLEEVDKNKGKQII